MGLQPTPLAVWESALTIWTTKTTCSPIVLTLNLELIGLITRDLTLSCSAIYIDTFSASGHLFHTSFRHLHICSMHLLDGTYLQLNVSQLLICIENNEYSFVNNLKQTREKGSSGWGSNPHLSQSGKVP